jgi:2-iminobutanoate/2-iminopropanoate deaminase
VDASVAWLTVAVEADDGIGEARDALGHRGLGFEDAAHLKFWAHESVDREQLLKSWLDVFPDRDRRPAVSVLRAPLVEPAVLEITIVATKTSDASCYWQSDQGDAGFPSATLRGDRFFVSALSGRDIDTGELSDDPAVQATIVFQRLKALIGQLGASPRGIGHLFVWYRDHAMRDVINPPFVDMFPLVGDRPARHSLVRELPAGEALEIEAMGSVSAARYCYTIGGTFHGGIGGVENSLPFGTKTGDTLYSAGTYGRDPIGGEIPDTFDEQLLFAAHYTKELLSAAGMRVDSVRHVYAWVREGKDSRDQVRDAVEVALFGGQTSAPVHVVAAALPGTNLIQLEIVATDR